MKQSATHPFQPTPSIVLPTEAKLLHFLIFGKCAKGFVFMSATGTWYLELVLRLLLFLFLVLMLLPDMISAAPPE